MEMMISEEQLSNWYWENDCLLTPDEEWRGEQEAQAFQREMDEWYSRCVQYADGDSSTGNGYYKWDQFLDFVS
jgi:hypothetical protein